MMSDRLPRRIRGASQAVALVQEEPADVACVACAHVMSVNAHFCRRCGERQPSAAPLVEVQAGGDAAARDEGIVAADASVLGSRPPLIPLWGPMDDLRARKADSIAVAGDPIAAASSTTPPIEKAISRSPAVLPNPHVFGSFTAESIWSPRAALPATDSLPAGTLTSIGRCTHARPRRSSLALCAICGGVPGPRVVSARTDGSGSVPAGMSAGETLSAGQRRAILVGAAAVGASLLLAPMATLIGLIAIATGLYVAILVQRIRIFSLAMQRPDMVAVSDEDALAIPASRLPIYTILIPAYREPQVMAQLFEAIHRLEYPVHKLDIKLLLEQDDPETLEAALAARPGPHVEIVRVPPVGPRTKPKACVVGLARARGQYVTIFDAEDQPEPLQLRKAILAFRRHPEIACFQAKLSYRNAGQNLITKWFTAEYAMWFEQFLPGLSRLGAPLPLGGTSNHFRRSVLRGVGGWDPFNVTEDADLGIRLSRAGHRTAVLDSTTFEEANSDFVNWVKQRSRWYKGYLQTWLIHMREPRRLWRELGPRGFVGFNLFVGGTPLVAIINPIFWAMTALWFLARPELIQSLFPAWLYYVGLAALVGGNFVFLYGSMISARSARKPEIVLAAVLVPVYWVMMSVAAVKSVIQLIHAPSFWEKTTHGLDAKPVPASAAGDPST